jgi:hypothetical protein
LQDKIIDLALLSSGIMAAAGRFGSSSDIDIEAILADKDSKSQRFLFLFSIIMELCTAEGADTYETGTN